MLGWKKQSCCRLAAHGARRCEQQAGRVGAPGRAQAENVRSHLASRCPRQGWACGRIAQDHKMQPEGLRKGDGSE